MLALCARNPAANVHIAERVEKWTQSGRNYGGAIWGFLPDKTLRAACWIGANVTPLGDDCAAAWPVFVDRLLRSPSGISSIYGSAPATRELWRLLDAQGWRARDLRLRQPLFVLSHRSPVPPDPLVRRALPGDFDVVFPASVAMFTEEVGYSPITADDRYRHRVAELLRAGRTYIRCDAQGQVIFKADIGARSAAVSQLHGVWLAPHWRGRGLSAAALATVVRMALAVTPMVSLYVNDFNTVALALYRRVGFTEVGTCATVLL